MMRCRRPSEYDQSMMCARVCRATHCLPERGAKVGTNDVTASRLSLAVHGAGDD